jgi:adenylate kinase family enzyme
MVTNVNKASSNKTFARKQPIVVELVGPAGAGKTSLAKFLGQQNEVMRITDPPYFRRVEDIPFFVKNTISLLHTFFELHRNHNGRWLTLREIAWMVTLNGWYGLLRKCPNSGTIIVLDQGPVFLLVQLYKFGPECLRSRKAEKWWDRILRQWAMTIDRVIYLDAPDNELLRRIRKRSQEHIMKEEPESRVYEFLAQYRLAYDQMICMLMGNGYRFKVLYFDTVQESIDEISNRLLGEFGLEVDIGEAETFIPSGIDCH